MPTFQARKYPTIANQNTISARYRRALKTHPFALFGLPFLTTMVAASFFLTPATALRYERHDRKVRGVTEEERIGLGKEGRKVQKISMAEEYARLQGRDLDNWDNKRVERLEGEHDGIL